MKKANILTRIDALHPRAVHFNQDFEVMVQRRLEVVGELNQQAAHVRSKLRRDYEWTVTSAANEPFLASNVKQLSPVRITRVWANKHVFDHAMELFGVKIADVIPVTVVSPVYYRMNGLLLHEGKGQQLLRTNVPCSDGEWEKITLGILDGFINQ